MYPLGRHQDWQNNADYNIIHKNSQKDTINFVCYNYTRDVFSVISKFFIPFSQIFVRPFSCDVKYLKMRRYLLIQQVTTAEQCQSCFSSHHANNSK